MYMPRRERRNRERRSISLYLQFVNHRTGQWTGDLADISASGFRLESTMPIRLYTQFTFRVDVPPGISDKPFIKVIARSLWCQPDPIDPRLYNTGFEILSVDASDAHALEVITDRYASRTIGADMRTSYLWDKR